MFARLRPVRPSLAVVIFAVLSTPLLAADEPAYKLKKGDHIVFLGDSITQAGAGREGLRHAHQEHADREAQGSRHRSHRRRHQRQQGARPPAPRREGRHRQEADARLHLHRHQRRLARRERSGQGHVAGEVRGRAEGGHRQDQGAAASVVLCTPSVIGEKRRRLPTSSTTSSTSTPTSAARSPRRLKLPVCDLRKAFVAYEKEHNTDNKEKGVLTGDRVHLNDAGNKFVAEQMMKMLGN